MAEQSPLFDPLKKRPLEISVVDRSDEEGVSDHELRSTGTNRVAADALFLIRVLFNDDTSYAMEVMSLVGQSHERMTVAALFDMWVRMAAYIVRDAKSEGESTEDLRQRKFCLSILQRLMLDENLQKLVAGLSPIPPTFSETEEPQVEPSQQLDEQACSTD